jgi:hypothetical protein
MKHYKIKGKNKINFFQKHSLFRETEIELHDAVLPLKRRYFKNNTLN